MTILNLLASQQGLKGDDANIALAKKITETGNKTAITELVGKTFGMIGCYAVSTNNNS